MLECAARELAESLTCCRDTADDAETIILKIERLERLVMATIQENSAQVNARLDAIEAQNTKALAEIRAALDAALAVQVTPDELAAAVTAAKAAQKTEDEAGFGVAVDAAFAAISEKLGKVQVASQALDDIVPDAVVPPPPVDVPPPPVTTPEITDITDPTPVPVPVG